MSCLSTHSLSAPIYNNVCVLAASASTDVQTNFASCCSSAASTVIKTDCYQYCNVTDASVGACFSLGLQGLNPPVKVSDVDINCINGAAVSGEGSSVAPSSTAGSSNSSGLPSRTASSTPSSTGAGASKSASSSAPPAASSTTSSSKASAAGSLSMGALAVVGLAVFGLLA